MGISLSSRRAVLRRFAALRVSSPRVAPPRFATQGFVMYNSTNAATWLNSPPCIARRRNSTLRFVCFFSRLNSRPLVSQRRGTPHRTSTQRFVYQFTVAPQRYALQRSPSRLNSTICLLLRDFTLLLSTQRRVALFNSTICLSIYRRSAPRIGSPKHFSARLPATPHTAPPRGSWQSNATN